MPLNLVALAPTSIITNIGALQWTNIDQNEPQIQYQVVLLDLFTHMYSSSTGPLKYQAAIGVKYTTQKE